MVHLCAGKVVVFVVDTEYLLGIVNRGSPRLKLSALAREIFWFWLEHHITLAAEWVPREENTLVGELSKLLIPDVCNLSRMHFCKLEDRFGSHSIDMFSLNANNFCDGLYFLHWCRGSGGVRAFAYDWSGEVA
jgi:hypothetical protein